MVKRTPDEIAKRVTEKNQALMRTGIAWMSRQAIGDAVLLLLREGTEPSRDAIAKTLVDMADGRHPEWNGHRSVAEQAIAFIADPPAQLPVPHA